MSNIQTQDNPPDASRTIEGLRDTGYTFVTSIADIIDNSISHGEADNIWFDYTMDYDGEISISISDDGHGIDEMGLVNAMKYGSRTLKDPASLGKFGMGLKTASSAFCRRYSLISRSNKNGDLKKTTWDLDHVAKVNKWEMLLPEINDEDIQIYEKHLGDETGTVVLWEKIDRLIREYVEPGGDRARKALDKIIKDDLEFHLSMTYQNFLDQSINEFQNIQIFINDKKVLPWDPFCKNEVESDLLVETTVPVKDQKDEEIEALNLNFIQSQVDLIFHLMKL